MHSVYLFYSFYVLTKEDKDEYMNEITYNYRKIKDQLDDEITTRIKNNEQIREFQGLEMASSYLNEKFQAIIKDKDINEFEWDILDPLYLKDELDV